MSGGYFNGSQYSIRCISDDIENVIRNNDSEETDEWGCTLGKKYCPEVIEKFKEAVLKLREAEVYAQRVDWLLSGDDGEDSFLRRLDEDLERARKEEIRED